MCSQYPQKVPLDVLERQFHESRIPLRLPEGRPNLEPRNQITIGDIAPVVIASTDHAELSSLSFGWKGPAGRPIFNFRSEGRSFGQSRRCLVPASGFYEFTDALAGQKRKTKWLFRMRDHDWLWMAGVVRDGAFALLTTSPGDDVAPYHQRQAVTLRPDQGAEWLTLGIPEADIIADARANPLRVERVFPPQ